MNVPVLLSVYWIFVRIGAMTFGGGYAMIPLFYAELVSRYKLISAAEFGNIVAIAQMTPGPIGVNAATYIGYHNGGVAGALIGTLGLLTPSLIIITVVAHFAEKFKHSHVVKGVLSGMRPTVIGLIAAAVLFFAEMSIFTSNIPWKYLTSWLSGGGAASPNFGVRWQGVVIFIVALVVCGKYKLSAIWTIILSAGLGMLLLLF